MKKIVVFFISLLVMSALTISAQSYNSPESVEWDAANNRWLISNTTSHAILARSLGGTLTTLVPTTGSGPHGIEIFNSVVYACAGGSIKGYNLSTGAEVFNLNLGGSFLNGLTTDGDSVLYATDFSAKKIYRINPATNKYYSLVASTVTTPNGIIYDGPNNRCIFVNWGSNAPIKAIDLTSYAITVLTPTTLGNCDGITRDSHGYYYVTAWNNNKLNRFEPDFTGGFTIIPGTLSSPADIDCKPGSIDTIGIPNAGNNTCSFIPLSQPIPDFTSSSLSVCEGDTIVYTNTSINDDSFVWTFTGGSPNTGTTSPISVIYTTAGSYTASLSATNVYGITNKTENITVTSTPAPTISETGGVLSVGTYTTYQWYQDGVLIPGATAQDYTLASGGAYTCLVSENGCTGMSVEFISTMGTENISEEKWNLYPNPADNLLTIEFFLEDAAEVQYIITDMLGKTLVSGTTIPFSTGAQQWTIPVASLPAGTYMIRLNLDGKISQKVFLKK